MRSVGREDLLADVHVVSHDFRRVRSPCTRSPSAPHPEHFPPLGSLPRRRESAHAQDGSLFEAVNGLSDLRVFLLWPGPTCKQRRVGGPEWPFVNSRPDGTESLMKTTNGEEKDQRL